MRTRRNLRNFLAFTVIATSVLSLAAAQPAPATSDWRNGRIAFWGCGDTGCDVYTVNPNGTALHQVTHDGSSFHPDWSPDAARIAYRELIRWLVADYAFDELEAYFLLTQAGKMRVGNMVDPKYTLGASIRKDYLPRD